MNAPRAEAIARPVATARFGLLPTLLVLLAGILFCGSALADEARLILVAGEVRLERSGAGQAATVTTPANGTLVKGGDTIVTGANGRVQISFSDGSLVSLQPRSEFRIDDYRFDMAQQRGFFSLVRGALRTISGAVGKRDPDDYRMTTPTATIGIRGTEFLVEETVCTPACHPGRSAGLRVAVSAGRVVVSNAAGSIDVPAGSAAYVADSSRAPVPTTERPTMSTAPSSIDFGLPPSGTRLADAKPGIDTAAGGGRSARAGTPQRRVAVASNAPRTTGGRSRTARPAPAMTEGVPAALLDQWSTRPLAALASTIDTPADSSADTPAEGRAAGAQTGKAGKPADASATSRTDAADPAGSSSPADSGNSVVPVDPADPVAGIDFNRPTAPGGGQPGRSPGNGDSAGEQDPVLVAVLAPIGGSTIPVGDSVGTNTQRGPDGVPIAIGDIGSGGGIGGPGQGDPGDGGPGKGGPVDGNPDNGDPGNGDPGNGNPGNGNPGNGNPGNGDPGNGDPGNGDPGNGDPGNGDPGNGDPGNGDPGNGDPGNGDPGNGDPGNGDPPPVLTPGLNDAARVSVRTLQSSWFGLNLTAQNSHVRLDGDYRLQSVGHCLVVCVTRNDAQVVDAGYNSDVAWGRWVNGTARLMVLGLPIGNHVLGSNNGVHYLVGVPTASMPTSGAAYYSIAGATSPTFASGAVAPGTFTGQGLVQFAAGLETRVAFKGDMVFGSGESYHLFSNGARTDSAGRLVEIGDTQIRMTGRNTFSGNIGVASQGSADRLGCGASNCRAGVQGGFFGAQAARMGVGYTVGRETGGGDTINGVAVLNRE